MIRLYDAIRDIISTNNSYDVLYQDLELSSSEAIGLYINDGGDTTYSIDGKVLSRVNNLHIQVQSKALGETYSPQDGFAVSKGIANRIEAIIPNSLLGDVYIISIVPIGGILYIGKNKENIPIFSINYKIKYVFKEEM